MILFVCLTYLSLISTVSAHQPRLISDQASSANAPTMIEEPEISKAYYAQLEKPSEYFRIDSNKEFDLYLSLQVPDIAMQNTNLSLELIDSSGLQLIHLNGSQHKWEKFHEDFGNADYLSGPSIGMVLPSGSYMIKISGEQNTKYVLVSGQKEEFPASEFLNSLFLVPRINQEFFGMNVFQSLANVFGILFLLIFSAIGFVILVFIRKLIQTSAKNKA